MRQHFGIVVNKFDLQHLEWRQRDLRIIIEIPLPTPLAVICSPNQSKMQYLQLKLSQ